LDFFSHHMYHRKPARIAEDMGIVRSMLDEKGFSETESILNEWNYNRSWDEPDYYSRRVRPAVKGAAFVAAVMCDCQNLPVDMLMYYDMRPNCSWCGPLTPFTYEVRPPYYALYYWAELAEYGSQIQSNCDTGNIYTCASKSVDGNHVRLLIVRYHEDDSHNTPQEVKIGLPAGWQVVGLRVTDSLGSDRQVKSSDTITLESNALALVEIERK
ncbi:MAG: hypothetical protein K6C37_01795, partial [Bacteroidales bacterium]|nr:hypothetical protein [Bacteroidales bacterium]